MRPEHKLTWRSPEEIVEITFQRSPVVIMNEAHIEEMGVDAVLPSPRTKWNNFQEETFTLERLFMYRLVF